LDAHSETLTNVFKDLFRRLEQIKDSEVTTEGTLKIYSDESSEANSGGPRKKKGIHIFSQKVFEERISLLTSFSGNSNYATLLNIAMAFLLLIGFQICFDSYFENGSFIPDTVMFFWAFQDFHIVLLIVLLMMAVHYLIVLLVQLVHHRNLSKIVYLPAYFAI